MASSESILRFTPASRRNLRSFFKFVSVEDRVGDATGQVKKTIKRKSVKKNNEQPNLRSKSREKINRENLSKMLENSVDDE